MTDDDKAISGRATWDRLNQQSDLISELARSHAATEASVDALATSVKAGFDNINANFARYESNQARYDEKYNRPTNWIGVGGLAALMIGVLLGFVAMKTDPINERTMANYVRLESAQDRELVGAREIGRVIENQRWLEKEQRLIDEWGSRALMKSTDERQ